MIGLPKSSHRIVGGKSSGAQAPGKIKVASIKGVSLRRYRCRSAKITHNIYVFALHGGRVTDSHSKATHPMSLTVKDLTQLNSLLCEEHLDYQMELIDGKIIVMGPSDVYASEVGVQLISFLWNWVYPRRLGRVFDSSGGFILPNTNLTAPDVSFVKADRLRTSPRYFAQMVPDLAVEIKSQSDRIQPLEEKVLKFLELGTNVGMLIDPDEETVTIYYSDERPPVVLTNSDTLTIPELLPGWSVAVSQLWPPVFDLQ